MLLNLDLHFGPSDGSWDLAALCSNCTNKVYIDEGVDGGAGSGNATLNSVDLLVARPRQVMLQLTVHPWRQ